MPVIVPNATSTSTSKFQALDQAEPDSLDFEILGSPNGVLTGGAVTSAGSSNTVNVAAGSVVVGGTTYSFGAVAGLALGAAPSDNQFAVVAVRVSDGSATVIVRSGDNSSTNPTFPLTANTAETFNSSTHLDLSTDVVLAAVYRSGLSTITQSRIVDKRKFIVSAIYEQFTGTPSGGQTGTIKFDPAPSNGVGSGVWVKKNDDTWVELAQNVGAHIPIGAVFAWPSQAPNVPAGCIEALGGSVPKATYPALAAAWYGTYEAAPDNIPIPNYADTYLIGTSSPGQVGTAVGANSLTLSVANLPAHSHPMPHTHNLSSHRHSVDLPNHTGNTGNPTSTTHNHPPSDGTNFLYRLNSASDPRRNGWIWFSTNNTDNVGPSGAEAIVDKAGGGFITLRSMAVNWESTVTGSSSVVHTHTLNHNHAAVDSGTPSTNSTGSSSAANTSNTGSGTAFDNRPASRRVRWLIRAALGTDPAFTGGGASTPQQETIIVELFGKGEAVVAEDALAQFRMPWPATVTGIRASVATASDSGEIQVNVDTEEVESACYVTIDEGDLTSTSSVDSDVVAENFPFDVADDSLVTFDLTNAGTNAEGSLTVTLYVTRAS